MRRYAKLFVELVVRNPLYRIGDRITSDAFVAGLNRFVRALPGFHPAAAS